MSFAENIPNANDVSITLVDPEAERRALVTFVQSQVRLGGVGGMTDIEREQLILGLCTRLGLNMIGSRMPIEIIRVWDRDRRTEREVLYFNRYATDQLADRFAVSRTTTYGPVELVVGRNRFVIAKATATRDGRPDEATGMVPIDPDADAMEIANCFLHAETKAKRRATLSILGLGFLDESELDTVSVAARDVPAVRASRATPDAEHEQTGEHVADTADSRFANRECAEEGSEASDPQREYTPLDHLRDALDAFGTPIALEQGIGVLLDHEREIPVEDHGRAADMVRERLPVPMSSSAFSRAITVAKQCEKVPLLKSIRAALAKPATADELVKIWRALAPEVATLDPYTRQLAEKDALFEAVRRIDPSAAHPNVWMKGAAASLDGRGPMEATTNESGVTPGVTGTPTRRVLMGSEVPQPPQQAGLITKIPRRAPRV